MMNGDSGGSAWRRFRLRARAIAGDRVRYSDVAQRLAGLCRLGLAIARGGDSAQGLANLASAHRTLLPVGWSGLTRRRMEAAAPGVGRPNRWRGEKIGWSHYPANWDGDRPMLSHSLIVKPPVSDSEKGVLVVWVEYNLAALLHAPDLPGILKKYRVVFSTSWSPPDFSLIWALAGEPGADLHIIASNPADECWLTEIPAPLRVLPFFASHWILGDDALKPKPPRERTYDFCVVANWAPFKRHWSLFRALRALPDTLRIALIGQPEGAHTVETAQSLAAAFGVKQRIDWFNRLAPDKVREIQADSRCGLMLSLREGSCLAVVESLLADSPTGVLRHAHIGSREFINDQTGLLLDEAHLARDLAELLRCTEAGDYRPREWAMTHAEARLSSEKLDKILADQAAERGEPWTLGILPFCLRAARPAFIDTRHGVAAEPWHEEFEREHGVGFLGRGIAKIGPK
jgi:glycosyltransferase involved in cell wall biosynthesis